MPSPSPSRVQALYELCKRTFPSSPSSTADASPSSPPPDHAIPTISSLLDTITPADVGLRDDNLEDDGRGFAIGESDLLKYSEMAQPFTYLHVYNCDAFSIGIFCLPTSVAIPLHDHPGMIVFTKLLYGSMHVKSYDWVEPAVLASSNKPVRLGKLHKDDVLNAPCPIAVLYPQSGGNIHCVTSLSSCSFLDVVAPNPQYRFQSDEHVCSYFHDFPFSSFSARHDKVAHGPDHFAWLETIDEPANMNVRNGMYAGPIVQV
uniref:cysteine dioxygenase n=1 Tax=Leersia perrieri TaxID=77586 RepID=A0A0D9VFI0_9ORYZ